MLGWILHDWQDVDCIKILTKAGVHLSSNGKILLLEKPLSPERSGPATSIDLTMLLQTGGKERTLHEYESLFMNSNLRVQKHIATDLRRDFILLESK